MLRTRCGYLQVLLHWHEGGGITSRRRVRKIRHGIRSRPAGFKITKATGGAPHWSFNCALSLVDRKRYTIYVAFGANVAIAIAKFLVAAITGSAGMLAEAIHSSIDVCNEILLLVGMRRSSRPADEHHPFGHGKELYFWSLMIAVLIFGAGGGVSIYEGFLRLRHPHELQDVKWSVTVIGIAAVFESVSAAASLKAFRSQHGHGELVARIIDSKDPTTFTILVEDMAALTGLPIALAGIGLTVVTGYSQWDSIASIIIGLLLAGVAGLLIRESQKLLVGEGVGKSAEGLIREIALQEPLATSIRRPLTMYLGPDSALLVITMKFADHASVADVVATIDRIKDNLQSRFPELDRIYIEAEKPAHAGVKRSQPATHINA